MMPKLTISVRRGLKTIASLAQADVEADQSEDCPQFVGQRLRDIEKALLWIGSLDDEKGEPR